MNPSYELFDHTADLGIRVRAATLASLIPPAAEGFYAAIGGVTPAGDRKSLSINIPGNDPAVILRDFLTELLILFERDRRFAPEIDVSTFTASGLDVTAYTQLVDFDRSEFHHEVKAVTYHELAIRAIEGGYEATLIVDI